MRVPPRAKSYDQNGVEDGKKARFALITIPGVGWSLARFGARFPCSPFIVGIVVGLGSSPRAAAQTNGPASNNPGRTNLMKSVSTRGSQTINFGPNVAVFDPAMSSEAIQTKLDAAFRIQERNQFGPERHAFLFKPGNYSVDANIGFNTQIAGLGFLPDEVMIKGYVRAEADWMGGNGTQNFWRSAENTSVVPPDGNNRWAVSQAAPFRRMHILGKLQLDPRGHGWSSGGFIADTKVDAEVSSGSQQQYMSRNARFQSWRGSVWNMVFVGVNGAPPPHFPNPSHTVASHAPVIREKPFLYVDAAGDYQVFVPALQLNASGTSWDGKTPAGASLPISGFFIVKPGANAMDVNAALAQGKDLLVTPGVYHLNETIHVARPNTVVLGMGLATFIPDHGIVAMKIADVDGVKVAGLLFDAGTMNSPVLLEVGEAGFSMNHVANPTSLHDVFVRIGGAVAGKATVSLMINSHNVIVDHTWLWRADHGNGVGWTVNPADTGLIVNGDDVTVYGLFAEHYQKYNVIWNGNNGRTYMFQNEMPYDPPNQASWMNGPGKGYAAYKVTDRVTNHKAWGVGSYCYFTADSNITSDHAFEAPDRLGVNFHNLLTVSLGGKGVISNVINNTGSPTGRSATVPHYLPNYPSR